MACLIYLQCTYMLRRCHSLPETLHFINTMEKSLSLYAWPPHTTRESGRTMVHPKAELSAHWRYVRYIADWELCSFAACRSQGLSKFLFTIMVSSSLNYVMPASITNTISSLPVWLRLSIAISLLQQHRLRIFNGYTCITHTEVVDIYLLVLTVSHFNVRCNAILLNFDAYC